MSDDPVLSAAKADAAMNEARWGTLRWVAGAATGNAEGLTLGRVTIRAGESNPRHCHPTCEEVLYLLAGRLRHTLGDEAYEMQAGDTIVIPAGVFHNAINIGEGDADMIVAFSSAHRDFVREDEADGVGEAG